MESALVNARVPLAKKESGNALLKKMGSSQSELVNRAYDYLLETKQLPSAGESARDNAAFAQFLDATSFDIDWGEDAQRSYKDILREGKRAEYESLA